jgi:GT2 family glycosyltransferase
MQWSAIIVTFHTPQEELSRLQKQLQKAGIAPEMIFVIENTVINRGFAKAVNIGIKKALKSGADLILLVNPDVDLGSISFPELQKGSAHFDIWGASMLMSDKTYVGGKVEDRVMSGGLITGKIETKSSPRRYQEAEFVSGSLMVIKREVIKECGYFDPGFFLYYEDVEYCVRAAKAGYRVGVDRALSYVHESNSDANPKKNLYLALGRLLFKWRHGDARSWLYELYRSPKTAVELTVAFFRSFALIRQYSMLSLSNVVIKALNFILFLGLIRFFTKEEYGSYQVAWAHVLLLSPLLDLGTTSLGITTRPQELLKTIPLFSSLRFWWAIVLSVISCIGVIISGQANLALLSVLALLPSLVSMANSGTLLIITSAQTRQSLAATAAILFHVVMIGSVLVTAWAYGYLHALFVLGALYGLYAIVTLVLSSRCTGIPLLDLLCGTLSFRSLVRQWSTLVRHSSVFIVIGFFASMYYRIDLFLLEAFKGPASVASYAAGYKFFDALIFLAANYSLTAAPRLAQLSHTKNFLTRVLRDTGLLTMFLAVITAAWWFLGSYLLSILIPHSYDESIILSKIVMLALPFIGISTCFINALYVRKRRWIVAGVFAVDVLIVLGLNMFFIPHYGAHASAWITVGTEVWNAAIFGLLCYREIAYAPTR